jgi:hypothetical protein
VHENKSTDRLDHLAQLLANCIVGGDGSANGNATVFRDFRCNVADAPDVDIAMLLGETEFGRKMLSYQIAIQQRYGTATGLQELGAKNIGDGGFS